MLSSHHQATRNFCPQFHVAYIIGGRSKEEKDMTVKQLNERMDTMQAQMDALTNAVENLTKAISKDKKKQASSSSKKQAPKPSTKSEALDKAYGSKTDRAKFVRDQQKAAQKELRSLKVKFTVNEHNKVVFAPFKEQTVFAHKSDFSQFREEFRANHKYA